MKSHVGDLAEGDIQHVFLLVCKYPVGEGTFVVDQLKTLVQLNGFWNEEDLVGVVETFDDALLIDVYCSVYSRPTILSCQSNIVITYSFPRSIF